MKKFITTIPRKVLSTVAIVASSMFMITSAQADLLLEVDLSVENTVTITSTGGLSSATISGSPFTGFYMSDMFDEDSTSSFFMGRGLVSGDLAGSLDVSDNTPDLFRAASGSDTGLNIWSYAVDTSMFEIGQQAFSGSATWTIDSITYLQAVNAVGGDIFFSASSLGETDNASLLGTWSVKRPDVVGVSAPATISFAVLGLAIMLFRRSSNTKA